MKFLERKICEKLMNMGCKSESGFYWLDSPDYPSLKSELERLYVDEYIETATIAFCLEDFVGTTDQARENCKKLFGLEHRISHEDQGRQFDRYCKCCKCARHAITDSNDWVEYITKTLKDK